MKLNAWDWYNGRLSIPYNPFLKNFSYQFQSGIFPSYDKNLNEKKALVLGMGVGASENFGLVAPYVFYNLRFWQNNQNSYLKGVPEVGLLMEYKNIKTNVGFKKIDAVDFLNFNINWIMNQKSLGIEFEKIKAENEKQNTTFYFQHYF